MDKGLLSALFLKCNGIGKRGRIHAMPLISLSSAIALTGKSERTLWRLVAEGSVQRELVQGKALFALASLGEFLPPCPLETEAYFTLIEAADQGNAEAQTELGLHLLELFRKTGKFRDAAFHWLEQAAAQNCADAMNWLARCHAQGLGVTQDDEQSLMWISRAAALGDKISRAQMQGLVGKTLNGRAGP